LGGLRTEYGFTGTKRGELDKQKQGMQHNEDLRSVFKSGTKARKRGKELGENRSHLQGS